MRVLSVPSKAPFAGRARLSLLVALWPLLVAADINRAHPPVNSLGLLTTDTPQTLPPWAISAGGWLGYTHNPLVYRYLDGSITQVITDQLWLEPVFNMGVAPLVDVAVSLPVLVRQFASNDAHLGDLSGSAVSDLRLVGKINAVPAQLFGGGLAVMAELGIPTGDASLGTGQGTVSFTPKVVGSLPLLRNITALGGIEASIRGTRRIGDIPVQSAFTLRGGVKVPFFMRGRAFAGTAELVATTPFETPFSSNGVSAFEGLLGATTTLDHGDGGMFDMSLGAGMGLSQAVGTPAARLIFALSWRSPVGDRDGDGVPDTADGCPDDPEDFNRYADLDGCPDADEARAHEKQQAVEAARPAGRSCPNGVCDRDHDGIPDDADMCPYVPEDKDGVQDDDGCPDIDNDHDGVPDDRDQCPREPETINGIDDEDGCPDKGDGATTFVPQVGITILSMVQFEVGRAVIKHESYNVLDQVALQLTAHDEVRRVRIEGHTDSAGAADQNLTLSQARAAAVRAYLMHKGVAGERLVAEGFGESRPTATNDTPAGRAKNRRVDFVILETAKRPSLLFH